MISELNFDNDSILSFDNNLITVPLSPPPWYIHEEHRFFREFTMNDMLRHMIDSEDAIRLEADHLKKSKSLNDYMDQIAIELKELEIRMELYLDPELITKVRRKSVENIDSVLNNRENSEKLEKHIFQNNNKLYNYMDEVKKIKRDLEPVLDLDVSEF